MMIGTRTSKKWEKISHLLMKWYIHDSESVCIMIHGYGARRKKTWWITEKTLCLWSRLQAYCIDSILFDLPGCGNSDWNFGELTIDSALDALNEMITLAQELGYEKIYLWWWSFGSIIALEYAKISKKIDGMALWATINDYVSIRESQLWNDIMEKWKRIWKINYEWFMVKYDFILSAKDHIGTDWIEKIEIPILCIHWDLDDNAPLSWAQAIVNWCSSAKLLVIEWEWHGFKYQSSKEIAIDETVKFLHQLNKWKH